MMLLRNPTNSLLSFLSVVGFSFFTAPAAKAQTFYWDANGATGGQTDGAGVWLTTNQWWDGTNNVTPTWSSSTNVVFGVGGAGGAVTLASPIAVGSLTFNYFTGTYTLGTVSQTLTINNGLTMNAGAGTVTLASPIKLGANQTWTNNTSNVLSVIDSSNNSVIDTNGFNLTFKGAGPSLGRFNILRGNGITGSGNVIVDNAYLDLRTGGAQSTNNYTGTTTVQNGGAILYFSNNIGTGNINLNGGTIEGYFNEGFTRPYGSGSGQFQITGGVSGFGVNGSNIINFSNITEVKWGDATFNPTKFVLGGGVSGGTVTFAEGIDLNGADRTVTTNVGGVLSAAVSTSTGTAGLIKEGAGNLSLTAVNTYNGATTINGGTLTLSGSGTIASTTALNLGGGTLQLTNTAQVNRFADVAISATAGGGVTYTNTAGAVNYTESLGALTLTKGQVNVLLTNDHNAAAGSQTLTFGTAGTGNLTQGGGKGTITFSAPTTGLNGTKNIVAVFGETATAAGGIIGPWATVGTAANVQTGFAAYDASGFVVAATPTAATVDTDLSSSSGNYDINTGSAFTLAATRTVNTVQFRGATSTLDLATFKLETNGFFFSGGAANAKTISGTGAAALTTASGGGNLYITTGQVMTAGSEHRIGVPITDNSGIVNLVKSGAGTLRLNGVNTFTGSIDINAGTLQIGTNGTANGAKLGGASGIYAGNIFIGAGANLDFQTDADQTLSGVISGDGNLLKRYGGTLTLGDNNTYTGKTTIGAITNGSSPTLVVSSFNSVRNPVASSSLGRPTTIANSTIDLGSNNSTPNPTLRHVGGAETTDRIINFIFNSTATRTLDTSGSGLLKFTSAFTSNGTATGHLVLQGTGTGEIEQGLPFAFTNLTKSNGGTWTLGGAVGSTGTLTVSGGTLALQQRSSLMGGANTNWTAAKVIVNSGATLALNVGGNGAFGTTDITTILTNLGGLGGAINNNGLRSGSRIAFNTTNATGGIFTIADNLANPTGTGSGAIGVTKLGTNILVLSGNNTYTGATTIVAGTLLVNGVHNPTAAAPAYTVAATATLGGSGTIVPAVSIAANATLTGGDPFVPSMNILSFGAGFSTVAGSNIAVRLFSATPDNVSPSSINDPTSNSFLKVAAGTTAIDTGTVFVLSGVAALDGSTPLQYRIATGTGDQTGLGITNPVQFDTTGLTNGNLYTYSITGDNSNGGNVYLNMTPVPIPEPVSLGLIAVAGLGLGRFIRRRRTGSGNPSP